MDNSIDVSAENLQKEFYTKLLKVLHLTNTVEWYDDEPEFSNKTTIFKRIFSKWFNFEDETLRKYFEYIEWETFLKFNESQNISIEVRKFVFPTIRNKIGLRASNPRNIFNPLCYYDILELSYNYNQGRSVVDGWNEYIRSNPLRFLQRFNHFCQLEKLPDASLIATSEFVALYYSSKIQFEWSREFINKYADYLNWTLLSCNSGLALTYELLDEFASFWKWSHVVKNPSLSVDINFFIKYNVFIKYYEWKAISSTKGNFWTEELIDSFVNQWDWSNLCENGSINWNLRLLLKFERFIDWKAISGNQNLELSIEVIDLYKDKFYWEGVELESIDDERGSHGTIVTGFGISSNSNFSWNKYFMTRYKEYLDWEYIESHNFHICWDNELIFLFADRLSWSFVFKEENLKSESESEYNVLELVSNMSPFIKASQQISKLNLSHDLLFRYCHLLDSSLIFQNKNINWNFSIFHYCKFK